MKWKRRCKNTAVSECGTYLVAGYRVDDRILYRASRGGVFVTDPLDSMDKINKVLRSRYRIRKQFKKGVGSMRSTAYYKPIEAANTKREEE